MTEFETMILEKLSGLTSHQQESLIQFLDEPAKHTKSTKEDIIVLSSVLRDLRNTEAYKKRNIRQSVERSVYLKFIKDQEKKIELEIYYHIRQIKGQLKKGGYENLNSLEISEFTPEEKDIYDSVFPENKDSEEVKITIPHPDMTDPELHFHDLAAQERHKKMRVFKVEESLT